MPVAVVPDMHAKEGGEHAEGLHAFKLLIGSCLAVDEDVAVIIARGNALCFFQRCKERLDTGVAIAVVSYLVARSMKAQY